MNLFKKLATDWRNEAKGPTLSTHKKVAEAYARCATELESMLNAVEALTKFRKGNGTGLPHGTVAWVLMDGVRYIREWHPMSPTKDGKPQGNWWPLSDSTQAASINGRFSEHEVTHYSIIEVPRMPGAEKVAEPPYAPDFGLQAIVGLDHFNGYVALAVLPGLSDDGEVQTVKVFGDTEQEALVNLRRAVGYKLVTVYENYKVVPL